MRVIQVPIEHIAVPEVRVTAVYDEELQELLKESLEAAGQIQPIVVVKEGERYELVDGLHRLEEARKRGDLKIPAVIYEGDSRRALVLNLITNRLRGKTKASEMVAVIGELASRYGMDSDAIQKETGLTRDYIEKLWRISEAAPGVLEALDAEAIGVGVAHEIARLPTHLVQEEYVAKSILYKLTVPAVKEFVDEVLRQMELIREEPAPVERPAPPRPFCEGCKETPEPKYLTPVLLCPTCYGVIFRHAREREVQEAEATPSDVEAPTP
ncbi:MAG: ParB/RepB/Spo0J family partition protein [Anaerolineae bacterium]